MAQQALDVAKRRSQALAHTNFAAVYATLPGNLTVTQNLRFFGRIYGIADLAGRIETLLAKFDLQSLRNTRCGVLSSGEQTRVALAKALLNRPVLQVLLAGYFFARVFRYTVRSGLLARYSAESIG